MCQCFCAVGWYKHKSGRELIREWMKVSNKGELMPLEKQGLHKSNHIPPFCRYMTSRKRKPEPARESAAGSTPSFLKFCVISESWESADLFPPLWVSVGGRCPVRHSEAEWKASSGMAPSSLNHFLPSRCSALFFPSLARFFPPCSNAVYLTEPWIQPASCCRCRCIITMSFRSSSFKFYNHRFNILYQIRCQSYFNKTSSTSLNVEVFYGCTKGRRRP